MGEDLTRPDGVAALRKIASAREPVASTPPPVAPPRRWPFALAIAGGAVAIAAGAYVVATTRSDPACTRRDPPALAGAAPEVAAVLEREVGRWREARDAVCAADPQPVQLACLDGVLDHVASARDIKAGSVDAMFDWLVDPARCATVKPPRVAAGAFAEVAAALDMLAAARERTAMTAVSPREPCARAIAMLGAASAAHDDDAARAAAYGDADVAATSCGDDRLAAAVALAMANAVLARLVDAPVDHALERADLAAQRIPQADVNALAAVMHARRHEQFNELDDAIRDLEPAIEQLGKRGRTDARLEAMLHYADDLLVRAHPDDFALIRKIVARESAAPPEIRARLAIADGFARMALGDLAGGHDEVLHAWALVPHIPPATTVPVSGTVVEGGHPVANATVVAGAFLMYDAIGMLPSARVDPIITTTDAAGHFAMLAAPVGVLVASAGDRRSRPVPVGTDTLTLEPTHAITGRVAPGAASSASAFVTARLPDDLGGMYRITAPVMPDGTFVLGGLPPTKIVVGASTDHTTPLRSGPMVEVDPATTEVSLALDGEGHYRFFVVVHTAAPADVVFVAIIARYRDETIDSNHLGNESFRAIDPLAAADLPERVRAVMRPGDVAAVYDEVADELSACAVATSMPADPDARSLWLGMDRHLQAVCKPILTSLIAVEVTPQKWPD